MKKFKLNIVGSLLLVTILLGCEPQQGIQAQPQQQPAPAPQGDAQAAPAPEAPSVSLDPILTRRNFYVIFDGSGSMNEGRCAGGSTKIKVAKKAVVTFAQSLGKDDNLGLFVFDNRGKFEALRLGVNNHAVFDAQVNAIEHGGGTPLFESIRTGYETLMEQKKHQLDYGEYHLVIVTDGDASDSDGGIMAAVLGSPIIIHTIGFCIGSGHALNQPGRTYYTDAQSPEDVARGLKSVLAESSKFDLPDTFQK